MTDVLDLEYFFRLRRLWRFGRIAVFNDWAEWRSKIS